MLCDYMAKKMYTLTVHITLHCIFAAYIFPLIQCGSLPIQLIPQLFGLQASVVDLIKCSGEFIGHLLIVGMLSLYCMTEPTSIICIAIGYYSVGHKCMTVLIEYLVYISK